MSLNIACQAEIQVVKRHKKIGMCQNKRSTKKNLKYVLYSRGTKKKVCRHQVRDPTSCDADLFVKISVTRREHQYPHAGVICSECQQQDESITWRSRVSARHLCCAAKNDNTPPPQPPHIAGVLL